MKKLILIFCLACVAGTASAQFPTRDSLEKFINRWIRNSAVDAFTNLRLNTAMLGLLNYADSAGIKKVEVSGTTLRIITVGRDTFSVTLPNSGGSGNTNSNIGSGFRLAVPNTNNIKTIFAGLDLLLDSSSNTNALTFKLDTAGVATYFLRRKDSTLYASVYRLRDSAAALRAAAMVSLTNSGDTVYNNSIFQYNQRRLNLTGTYDTLYFDGDSYVAGQGSSTGRSFAALAPPLFGKIMGNLGVGGTGAKVAVSAINNTLAGYNNQSAVLSWFGYNDLRRSGSNVKTFRKIYNAYVGIMASAMLSENAIPASSASTTGTWTAQDIGPALGGKSTKMGGTARYAQSSGATMSWTFTGTNLAVGTVAYDGVGVIGGKIKVAIDGTPIDTIDVNGQTDFISDGVSNNAQMIFAKVYWDLAATSHTVLLTTLDANTVYIDYLGVLNGIHNAPPVYISLIPKMKSSSYALGSGTTPPTNLGSDAVFNSGDSMILLAARQFISRNYQVAIVEPNKYFNPNDPTQMDADDIHPSDTGYAQILKAIIAVTSPYSYTGLPSKNRATRLYMTQDTRLLFGEATPDMSKDIGGYTYESAVPRIYISNPAATQGKRGFRMYQQSTGRTVLGGFDLGPNIENDYLYMYPGSVGADSVVSKPLFRAKQLQSDSALTLYNLIDGSPTDSILVVNNHLTKKIASTSLGATLTTNYIGYGISSALSGTSSYTFDGTTVKQENSAAVGSIVNTASLGSTSGAQMNLYTLSLPTGASQQLGILNFGSRNGATTADFGAAIEAQANNAWANGTNHRSDLLFKTANGSQGAPAERMRVAFNGNIGIGQTNPTARLHLPAGAAAASSAPLKFGSGGVIQSTVEAGTMEYDGTNWYLSPSTTRKRIPLTDNSTPTNGQLPVGNGTDYTVALANQFLSITSGASNPTIPVTAQSYTFLIDASGGNVTLTIGARFAGQIFHCKRIDASGNTVTIQTAAGTIDGSANFTIATQWDNVSLIYDGTNYYKIKP